MQIWTLRGIYCVSNTVDIFLRRSWRMLRQETWQIKKGLQEDLGHAHLPQKDVSVGTHASRTLEKLVVLNTSCV